MKTLKDLQQIWTEEFKETILNSFHEKIPACNYDTKKYPVLIQRSIFRDGKEQYIEKCTACNKIHFVNKAGYYSRGGKCPICEASVKVKNVDEDPYKYSYYNSYNKYERLRLSSSLSDKEYYSFITKIDDDSFSICIISRIYNTSITNEDAYIKDGPNNWLDKPFISSDSISGEILFSKKNGARIYSDARGELLRAIKVANEYIETNISKTNVVENDDKNALLSLINKELGASYGTLAASLLAYNIYLESKRVKKVTKNEENTFSFIPPLKRENVLDRMKKNMKGNLLGGIIDVSGNVATYSLFCHCGNIIDGKEPIKNASSPSFNVKTTCPCCGRPIDQYLSTRNDFEKMVNFSLWERIDYDNVILRLFSAKVSYDIHKREEKVDEFKEHNICLFTPEKMFYLSKKDGKWEKESVSKLPLQYTYYYSSNEEKLYTEEELNDIFENSFMKTTGAIQALGLGEFSDYKIETLNNGFNRSSYLYQIYRKPYLELVVKANLKKIAKELLEKEVNQNYLKATNIYDMFGITKTILKITRLRDLSLFDMALLKRCYSYQSNFSLEQWDNLVATRLNIGYFLDTCEKTESTIPRLLEYLQSCYDNQCIVKTQALSIFNDYYRMAKDIGFNVNDNSIKYPNSLKKEHDKAIFAYRVVENEIKKKAFIEHSKENKKYEYSKGDFVVIIPMNPDEVIREGQLQKHCVASYVKRIEEGTTCICFIRKKDDIDTPYYTCEIFQGKLYQVKGYCNKYPKKGEDDKLIEFLKNWAEKKQLTVEYMKH